MDHHHLWFILFLLLGIWILCLEGQGVNQRLRPPPTYMIVAPKVVRSNEVVQVYISIFQLRYPLLNVRAAITRNGEEIVSARELFTTPSSRLTQLRMPEYSEAGNYTLIVEGSVDERISRPIFTNETELIFQPKRVSVFILTDQTDYRQRSTINFRIIAVQPNLLPVRSGSIDIYIRDDKGLTVKRWLGLNVNHGFYENSVRTGHPAKYPWWTIEVRGWGYVYRKTFKLKNFYYTRHENLIKMPPFVYDNEYAIGGSVKTQLSLTTVPVRGNATMEYTLTPATPTNDPPPVIKQEYGMIYDKFSFNVPLDKVQEALGTENIGGTGVKVSAVVKDWNSLETKKESGYTEIFDHTLHIKFIGGRVRVFRPGQTLDVQIAVFTRTGGKIQSSYNRLLRIQTTVERDGHSSLTLDDTRVIGSDSIVKHSYVTQPDDRFIKIRAAYIGAGMDSGYKEMTAYRHHTESGHYLFISTSTEVPKINQYIVFTVRATTFIPELHYQVMSKGNILLASTLFMKHMQKTFSLAASREMIPHARIVIWGLTNNGEVLTDCLSFHVAGENHKNFKIKVNWGKDFSRNTVELNAFTNAGALTGLQAEMKEVVDLGVKNYLTEHMLDEELSTYEVFGNTSYKHTWHYENYEMENIYFPAPSSGIDANKTFENAGLVVITDAGLTRIEGAKTCNVTLGYLPCFDGGCYRIVEGCDDTRQCEDGADEMGCPLKDEVKVGLPDVFNQTTRRWHYLAERRNWAWKTYYTKPYSRIDVRLNVPLRPVEWLINGFSLDSEKGLAISTETVVLDSTRNFFIMVEVPRKAFRGEQLGVQVSVFNRWTQPMEVIIMLLESPDYRFILVEDHGYANSYNPRTTSGDVMTMVSIREGETTQIHFPILPTKLGSVKVSIKAMSITNMQTVTKSINILMDGVTNTYHTTYLVDLENTGSLLVPYLEIPVPQRFIDPGSRKHLYVPGSERTEVGIVGDVVGPGFFDSFLTAGNTLGLKFGQGEQYLYNFGANLYWLKFLKTTNQLSTSTLQSVLGTLSVELQHVYAHMQDDGALDLRRRKSPSDTWFSALTLEILVEAVEPEWEQLFYIDIEILNRLALWLTSRQDMNTGAFWNEAESYDAKFKGNLTNKNGVHLNISLTATAVISLAKSYLTLTGPAQNAADNAAIKGAAYLAQHFNQLVDPFEICIVTYALHVANHEFRTEAFRKMDKIRRTDVLTYWSTAPIPGNRLEYINAVPYLYSRPTPPVEQAAAVHATSFALLTYIRRNRLRESEPIMKWLQTQRNFQAGFVATQDTLAALRALVAYAERETNRQLHRVYSLAEATSSKDWNMRAVLNISNFMTQQSATVPHAWGAVKGTFQGTGMALFQMTTTVNVEYPELLRQPQIRAFDLEIDSLAFKGRNGSNMEMNICVRWVATHLGPRSGAAVLTLDIPTGFFVRKDVLKRYQRVGRIHSQRSRFTSQKVVMYFDYLDTERSCFFFHGERWYPVANATIQHHIEVYDTYNTALYNRSIYTTFSLFHLHICRVCGSFQCPYCPHYNTAPPLYTHWILLIVPLLSILNYVQRCHLM